MEAPLADPDAHWQRLYVCSPHPDNAVPPHFLQRLRRRVTHAAPPPLTAVVRGALPVTWLVLCTGTLLGLYVRLRGSGSERVVALGAVTATLGMVLGYHRACRPLRLGRLTWMSVLLMAFSPMLASLTGQ